MSDGSFGLPKLRERVKDVLAEAFADDNLEHDDFERRIEAAENAKSLAELRETISDFPVPTRAQLPELFPEASPPVTRGGASPAAHRSRDGSHERDGGTMVRILGDTDLELSDFEVEDKTIVSVLGDTSIDLSGLQPEYGTVGIRMMSVLGDVTLVVPMGTDVIRDASLILGDFKIRVGGKRGKRRGKKRRAASDDDELDPRTRVRFPAGAAPKVRISGFSLLGDVTIVEV